MLLTVLIPAHNEQRSIQDAVASVAEHADRVVVVADNCTDRTADLAREAGADVLTTVGNTGRKAGALNQALRQVLSDSDDLVMVMDADSTVSADFVPVARRRLARDATLGAVGGVFFGAEAHGWWERAQANEYARYSRSVALHHGRVSVLTGTAAVFRAAALRDLQERRGHVYDETALTEDNEITLALKTAGWRHLAQACRVSTELMPTVRTLHQQRLRWYRGAIQNLVDYGWTPVTRRYWLQQGGLAAATLAMALYWTVTVWAAVLGLLQFSPFWTAVGMLYAVERIVTAWPVGWRGRLLAALVVPETVYAVFLQATFVHAVWTALQRRTVQWHHL